MAKQYANQSELEEEYVSEEELEPEYATDAELEPNVEEQPSGNFITNLINQNRNAGVQGVISAIPTSGEEALDALRVAGRQVLPGSREEDVNFLTQGPFGFGLNLAGIDKASGYIQKPQTQYGQTLETSADIAQLLAGASSIKSMISSKFPKKMSPSKIEDQISKLEKNKNFKEALIKKSKDLTIDAVSQEFDVKTLQAKEKLRSLRADAVLLRQSTQDDISGLNATVSNLDNTAIDQARNLTLAGREKFFGYASKLSADFGKEARAAGSDVEIPYKDLKDSIDESMKNGYLKSLYDKLTFAPEGLSSEDKKVLSFVDNIRSTEGVDRIPLLELDNQISGIVGKPGKQYSSAQRSLTELRRIYLNAVGDSNKELNLVKAKFRPKLQFKDKFYEVFEPFNQQGPLDTTKGTSYFKKIVDGDVTRDDLDFIQLFEREVGPELLEPIKKLSSEKSELLSKINKTKEFYKSQSRAILGEKFNVDNFIRNNDALKVSAIEKAKKPFDLEAINSRAKEGKSREVLVKQLDEAEKMDLPRKIIRMAVKEGLTQLKRNAKGF